MVHITFLFATTAIRQSCRDCSFVGYCEAPAKKGTARQEVAVWTCFGPLLGWVRAHWPPSQPQLALALNVNYCGGRFMVLTVSVVYAAPPVAWAVLTGNQKAAWHPHWVRLLTTLALAVPADWT